MIKVYQIIEQKNNVVVEVPYKKMKVRVTFENGNVLKGSPATLYTRDKFVQFVLDNSKLKDTLYRLQRTIDEAGDEEKKQQQQDSTDSSDKAGKKKAGKKSEAPIEPVTDSQDENASKAGSNPEDGKKLEFDNLADAIGYVASTFDEATTSEREVSDFLKGKGYEVTIHKAKA